MAPLSPTQAAYIAGLLDGEGTVSTRSADHNTFRLEIFSSYEPVIDWLLQFGGRKRTRLDRGPIGRLPQYIWVVDRKFDLASLLPQLLPYLIIKRTVVERFLGVAA